MRSLSPYLFVLVSSLAVAACSKKDEDKKDDKKEEAKSDKGKDDKKDDKADKKSDAITIKVKAPAVGDKDEEKETSDMKMAISIDMGGKKESADVVMTESMIKKTEVMAVDGNTITKAKVNYVEKKKTETEGGKEKKKPKSPLDGKTFIFEWKDGKLLATDDKGKRVTKDEDEAIQKANREFGKPDPFIDGMPTKEMAVGDKIDKLAKAIQDHLRGMDDSKEQPEVSDVEVKLESIEKDGDDKVAVFALKLTMGTPKGSKDGLEMKAPLKGKLRVRAKDGAVLSVDLKGPMTMESTDPKLKLSAKGDIAIKSTHTR